MIEKFVVYSKESGEYFKRGYGLTLDQKRARLYSRRGDAVNSLRRKGRYMHNFDVYPVLMDLTVEVPATQEEFDTFKAVQDVEAMPFQVAVKYFRDMYSLDIAGTRPSAFPLSVDMVAIFSENIKHLGNTNGTQFLLSDKIFETSRPLPQMIGAELLRQFGYTSSGKRVALFKVDWFEGEGVRKLDY